MRKSKLISLFRKWQKEHYNFMSKKIWDLLAIGKKSIVIEISYSVTRFCGLAVYGVTVCQYDEVKGVFNNRFDSDLNKCFTDVDRCRALDESVAYAKSLYERLK